MRIRYTEGLGNIIGYLRSLGIFASRERIRLIMREIDAAGVEYRSREIIQRGRYRINYSLEMCHADACCKLVNVCYICFVYVEGMYIYEYTVENLHPWND